MTDHTQHYADPDDVPDHERLEVKYIPLDKIHGADRNHNSMSEPAYLRLKAGIDELGFVQNLVVVPRDDGEFEIADGHHRHRALSELGWQFGPSYVAEDWDAAQHLIARIGLNKNRGELNLTMVAEDITYLADTLGASMDDMICTGYDEGEINDMLATMRDDLNAVTPQDIAGTTITNDEPTESGAANPRPFLLEFTFASKAERKAVRDACKRAGNGDITDGLLVLAGVEETD